MLTTLIAFWNNKVARWLAVLGGAILAVMVYGARQHNAGKREERRKHEQAQIEKRLRIEEAQNEQVADADRVRRDSGVSDDEPPADHHFRD